MRASLLRCLLIVTLFACQKEDDIFPVRLDSFTLSSPENDQVDIQLNPVFTWNRSADSLVNYRLLIAEDDEMNSLVFESELIADTTFKAITDLMPGTAYFWQAVAFNSAEQQVTSEVFTFRTAFDVPAPSPDFDTYYVDLSGNDSPDAGSSSNPFRTVAYAMNFVPEGEGDVVMIGEGEFYESEPIKIPPGVSLVGAGVDATLLKSAGVRQQNPDADPNSSSFISSPDGSLIQLVSANRKTTGNGAAPPAIGDQRLSDFSIDGSDKQLKAGIWIQNRSHVDVQDVNFYECRDRGMVITTGNQSGMGSFFMQGIQVDNCFFRNSGRNANNYTTGNLGLGSLDGALIRNIKIEDDEGYGVKFFIRGYFKNCTFDQIETQLSEQDELWGEKISVELWNLGPGNEISNVIANTWMSLVNDNGVYEDSDQLNALVHDIKIVDQDGISSKEAIEVAVPNLTLYDSYFEGKGFGVAVWNMGWKDITIRHNIIRSGIYQNTWNESPGIYVDNSTDNKYRNLKIHNNVIDHYRHGVLLKGNLDEVQIHNNVFLDSEVFDVRNDTDIESLFTHNFSVETSRIEGPMKIEKNLIGNPNFDPSVEYLPFANSPLIDSGVDVGVTYNGTAPDIGAFETDY